MRKCLSCKGLSIGYDRKVIAEDITFELHQGDYLCIIGENGAGKSTLMKTLVGLLKPIEGQIQLHEGLEAGYLSQTTAVQEQFPATVEEIVQSGALKRTGLRPFYSKEDKRMAKDYIKELGLWSYRHESFRNLSGGQKQRVLLGRALTASRDILFMDEPMAGLDVGIKEELYGHIKDLNNQGMTIVMISHDMEAAYAYGSHFLHVEEHKVVFTKKEDVDKSYGKGGANNA